MKHINKFLCGVILKFLQAKLVKVFLVIINIPTIIYILKYFVNLLNINIPLWLLISTGIFMPCITVFLFILFFKSQIKNKDFFDTIIKTLYSLNGGVQYKRIWNSGDEVMSKNSSKKIIIGTEFNESTNEIECWSGTDNVKTMLNQELLKPYTFTPQIMGGNWY